MNKEKIKNEKDQTLDKQVPNKNNNTILICSIFTAVIVILLLIIVMLVFSLQEKDKSATPAISNLNTPETAVNINEGVEETITETNVNTNTSTPETTKPEPPAELTEIADLELTDPENVSQVKYYNAGNIAEGTYKGYELILLSADPMGPHFYPYFLRFVRKDGKLVLLKKHSDYDEYVFISSKIGKDFTIDEDTTVAALTYVDIYGPKQSRQFLQLQTEVNEFFSEEGLGKAFMHEEYGQVYTTQSNTKLGAGTANDDNGFYIKAIDGTVKVYALKFDFFTDNGQPDIAWDDGKEVDAYTTGEIGGCGSTTYAAVMTSDVVNKDTDLVRTGVSAKGDVIYELKDKNHALLKAVYESYNPFETEKVSYDEFVTQHPLFFFVDSFDRLVKAQSNSFIPAAECGKPVVYLYPEQTTDVSVRVNVSGGMSVSIPEYKNGWDVTASPDGTIYHPQTQQNYPYLFWEGRSKTIMPAVEEGFAVEKQNIHLFLEEKLTKLGLNDKERADFEAFWEPRMQSAPYYFVTFLGNREMDALVPMEISPKPDTVIRIFMDFRPLEQPIQVRGYEIKTPERKGFTAVEWGGTL